MKHINQKITTAALLGALLLSGCGTQATEESASPAETAVVSQAGEETAAAVEAAISQAAEASVTPTAISATVSETAEEYFSSRDLSGDYDSSEAAEITLSGSSISSSSEDVTVSGSIATITAGGTYIISGTLENGSIIVDTTKDDKVQLVLSGVSISSDTFAPIYVKQADKVFVTLADGTENTLTNGGSFVQTDDNEVDAVIFSKDDLTLNGTGSLTVDSPAGHGIVGKDEVTITGGSYTITSAKTAIRANDSIAIAEGSFLITADTDGLHAEDNDDDSVGSIYIQGGSFDITAGDDGIHATTTLTIDGGSISVKAVEGLEATIVTVNDGTISISASDDGINASKKSSQYSTPTVTFNGGSTTIVMGAGDTDGVDANGDIVINGGTIDVTGNSTFDYDGTGTLNGGTVIVNGEEVTSLPNQSFGGMHGGMGNGQRPDGMGNGLRPDGMGRGQRPDNMGEPPSDMGFGNNLQQS